MCIGYYAERADRGDSRGKAAGVGERGQRGGVGEDPDIAYPDAAQGNRRGTSGDGYERAAVPDRVQRRDAGDGGVGGRVQRG